MTNKRPVLAIDARLYQNRSGAGRIATATVDRIVSDHADSFEKIVLIAHSKAVYDSLPTGTNVKKALVPGHFLFGKLFIVPLVLFFNKADAYFSPTSELPLWKLGKTKYLNMVHDLFMEDILDRDVSEERSFFLAIKHFFRTRDALKCFYLAGLFRSSFFRADSVLAISDFSLRTLCERYGIPISKCRTLSIGADELFFRDYDKKEASDFVRSRFGIEGKYVFTYDAMADFRGFSKRFEEVCARFGLKWVILSRYAVVYDTFTSSGAGSYSTFIKEFVSDEELANLVRGSEFIFFPSGGEGFGIPIAECLACGKTLLVPGITAMPEVGGPHVTCYDPGDIDDLVEKAEGVCARYGDFKIAKDDPYLRKYSWPSFVNSLVSLLHAELN